MDLHSSFYMKHDRRLKVISLQTSYWYTVLNKLDQHLMKTSYVYLFVY